jgi:energy-coupling factor transporter transmembrane protein EcfT
MSAQKARGSSLDTGGFIKKVKALVPVLIPLLIGSFNIADQLGDAMDARCYGTGKRTKYKKLTFALRDLFAFAVVVIVIVAIIILNKTLGGI